MVVSTPQAVALIDVRRGVSMFQKTHVPILGVIENMAYFAHPSTGAPIPIFGHGGAKSTARAISAPFLGEIPIEVALREACDAGRPLVVDGAESLAGKAFVSIAAAVLDAVETGADASPAPGDRVLEDYRDASRSSPGRQSARRAGVGSSSSAQAAVSDLSACGVVALRPAPARNVPRECRWAGVQLVAEQHAAADEDQDDRREQVAHLQPEDGVRGVHHPLLAAVADQFQDREDDSDDDRRAELGGGGDHRIEQAVQVLPGQQPSLVDHVGHHRADQWNEGRDHEPDREHAANRRQGVDEPVAWPHPRDSHQPGLGDGVTDTGDLNRPVFAQSARDAAPEGRADQAGADISDQEQPDVADVEPLGVLEEEDIDRAGGAGPEGQDQVGHDDPPHRRQADRLPIVSRRKAAGPLRLAADPVGGEQGGK